MEILLSQINADYPIIMELTRLVHGSPHSVQSNGIVYPFWRMRRRFAGRGGPFHYFWSKRVHAHWLHPVHGLVKKA